MGETIGKGVTCERSQRGDDLDWDIRERQVLLGFQICVLGRVKRRAYSSIKFHRPTPYFSHGPLQVETCLYRIGIFSIIFQPSYTLCDPNDAYQHCPGIAPSLFASADGSHSLMGLLFRRCFLIKKKSGGVSVLLETELFSFLCQEDLRWTFLARSFITYCCSYDCKSK